MLTEQDIKGKWLEIKGAIRNVWSKISDEELDGTKGNLLAVASLVQDKYGQSRDTIKEDLENLMDSFDNPTDKNDFYTSSYQRSPLGADQGATSDKQHTSGYDAHQGPNQNVSDFDLDRNARH